MKLLTRFFLASLILLCVNISYAQTDTTETLKESESILDIWDETEEIAIDKLDEQEEIKQPEEPKTVYTIFDDKMLLNGYAKKYAEMSKDIIMAMIKDDTLSPYKMAAAVRVFRNQYAREVVSREKKITVKILWRRLNRTNSAFVQVEIMHTLCMMDRYRFFKSLVPELIQKLDHYNETVNEIAFNALNSLLEKGTKRSYEARIVFNTLRKVLFLSRKRLANITEPGPRLKQKLKFLRWSVKILGNQELKRLPKEVISLL